MVGRHNVSSYFYCCIRPERLLHDAERDLLAIGKFLVQSYHISETASDMHWVIGFFQNE